MHIGAEVVAVIGLVIGVAMVAVILSKNAQTPQVFQAGGSALAQVIGAAVAPVSGNSFGSVGQTTGGTSS